MTGGPQEPREDLTPDAVPQDVERGADAPPAAAAHEPAPAPAPEEPAPAAEPVEVDPVAQVTAERDQYLDALQRLKAEFDNYRKRVDRDREAVRVAGVQELVSDLLPVIDNLERALEAAPGAEVAQIVEGVAMVRGQLSGILTGRGVEAIEAEGKPFDPEVHDAVTQHPSHEHEEGAVMHVLERGYRIGDTIIRPAKVVVAARPPGGDG